MSTSPAMASTSQSASAAVTGRECVPNGWPTRSCYPCVAPRCCRIYEDPADLAHATLLHEEMLPLSSFPSWRDWLAAAGVEGVNSSRGPQFSHTHLMLQAAVDGRGIALGQALIVADDLAAGRLVAPFQFRLPTGFGYYLVCPQTSLGRAKIKAFREWIVAELGHPLCSMKSPPSEGAGSRSEPTVP